MDFQVHAQSDKASYHSIKLFKLFSAAELVYKKNKIALIAANI